MNHARKRLDNPKALCLTIKSKTNKFLFVFRHILFFNRTNHKANECVTFIRSIFVFLVQWRWKKHSLCELHAFWIYYKYGNIWRIIEFQASSTCSKYRIFLWNVSSSNVFCISSVRRQKKGSVFLYKESENSNRQSWICWFTWTGVYQ